MKNGKKYLQRVYPCTFHKHANNPTNHILKYNSYPRVYDYASNNNSVSFVVSIFYSMLLSEANHFHIWYSFKTHDMLLNCCGKLVSVSDHTAFQVYVIIFTKSCTFSLVKIYALADVFEVMAQFCWLVLAQCRNIAYSCSDQNLSISVKIIRILLSSSRVIMGISIWGSNL
jgi:hypothetical protein